VACPDLVAGKGPSLTGAILKFLFPLVIIVFLPSWLAFSTALASDLVLPVRTMNS
jgi:hypothetical protein